MNTDIFNAVGIENEGAWKDASPISEVLKADGSVIIPDYRDVYYLRYNNISFSALSKEDKKKLLEVEKNVAGEVASAPLKNMREIKTFLKDYFPDVSNHTCGLHIHCSFKKIESYAVLMTKGFFQQFVSMVNKFGDDNLGNDEAFDKVYWDRFMNKNQYVQRMFSPLDSLTCHKYRNLNFSSFQNRQTFENRAFPAFPSRELTELAIKSFLELCEDYIGNFAKPNDPEVQKNIGILKRYLPFGHELNQESIMTV